MIEIKSEWKIMQYENGKNFPMIVIYIGKNNEWYHCGMDATGLMDNADKCKTKISTMIINIIEEIYPELKDELYIRKKQLEQHEMAVTELKRIINIMEKEKKEL